jgi:dTDP-4-amino-4,6-dideoxygalactose transaminase
MSTNDTSKASPRPGGENSSNVESNYQIPLFALNYDGEEEAAVLATLRSRWISMGPKVVEIEAAFARALGIPHALAVANCTAALHMAMLVLGIGRDDEVIVPSLTFVATANALRYVGAVPVFADICGPADLRLDPSGLEALIRPRTKAIVVMHYAGFPCAMDEICAVARRHGLAIIEDSCHGPLSEYRGRKLGTIGDVGCFSFFSNKNISTGEGGLLVTPHAEHHARAVLLRSHGMTTLSHDRARGHAVSYDVVDLGYNYRLDDIHAALALVQLKKLAADLDIRARVRARYLERLADQSGIVVPFADHAGYVSNYIFPIVLREGGPARRDAVRRRLQEAGIQTSVHYPAVHRFSIYERFAANLPRTEHASDHLITLPMYASLSSDAVDFIADRLQEALV